MPAPTLLDVAAAIADGTAIDWEEIDNRFPGSSSLAERARLIERVAEIHTALPPASSFSESLRGTATHDRDERSDSIPATWGTLAIIDRIGGGTFGNVYRAHDPRLNRHVALKLLKRKDRRESAVIEEGQLLARVRHPNIVTVYGAERVDGRVGLWMELIEGQTLEQELTARGPFPPSEVLRIGLDLARALGAVHRAGLLHRDVKAQNVMRDADGRVLLTDFGAGREVAPADEQTQGPDLAGTPLYLAPEVLAGGPASPAADLYSLGVLLFRLATHSFPVQARSLRDLRDAHARHVARSVATARRDIPRRLAKVIDRALHRNPSMRYTTAGEFESALAACAQPRFSRHWAGAAAATILLATAVAVWSWRTSAAPARLGFAPHDVILITAFDNRTSDSLFNGAVEYALERELSASDVVGLVSGERVDDALRLMKRPPDTTVDRAVGREVAVRDGQIKALLAGRLEKLGSTYVLTAQLIDPANDSIVTTITEEAADGAVGEALKRAATRVRLALGERHERITGINRQNEPVSTRSLKAFQLYQEASQLQRQGRFEAALELARRSVAEDPEFATGWILVAWTAVAKAGAAIPGALQQPHFRAVRDDIRPALDHALRLADTLPEWERLWVLGSYHSLSLEPARAIPFYEALLQFRPDHHHAARNLQIELRRLGRHDERMRIAKKYADQRPNSLPLNFDAAALIVERSRKVEEAKPFIDRVRRLLPPVESDEQLSRRAWLEWLPMYVAWESGDVDEVLTGINRVREQLPTHPVALQRLHEYAIGDFLAALGQLKVGEHHHMRGLPPGVDRAWEAAHFAYVRNDLGTVRRLMPSLDFNRFGPRTMLLMRAGLVEQARTVLQSTTLRREADETARDLAQAELMLYDGRLAQAAPLLRQAVATLRDGTTVDYYAGCESLATALKQLNQTDDAIAALEECESEPPRYTGANLFRATHWLRLKLRLADEYRQVGRADDARRHEHELHKRLTYAEPDNPLLRQLQQRQ